MRYLVDTNLLVNIVENKYISDNIRYLLDDYESVIYISSESVIEFIHLIQHNKIKPSKGIVVVDVFDFIENQLGFIVKYVQREHLKMLAKLGLVDNHTDPSDRLIIAMAITEKIPCISSDAYFPKYKKQGLELILNHT